MNKSLRYFITLVIIVLMLPLVGCASLKDVNTTGKTFMQALKDQDNTASWNLLSDSLQKEIGDETNWAEFTAPRAFETWKFTSTSFSDNTGEAEGTAEIRGETYNFWLGLVKVDSTWLIEGIEFKLSK